jgi:hypothetical protein
VYQDDAPNFLFARFQPISREALGAIEIVLRDRHLVAAT